MPSIGPSLGGGCSLPPRRICEPRVASPPLLLLTRGELTGPVVAHPVGDPVVVDSVVLPVVVDSPCPLTGLVAILAAPGTSSSSIRAG